MKFPYWLVLSFSTGLYSCIAFAFYLCYPPFVEAAEINYERLHPNAAIHLPILLEQQSIYWPDMDNPSIFAAQVDTETCPTFCWSPTARLKTSREEGYGLGQITRAWRDDGTLRFDALEELRQKHQVALHDWSWKNIANATFQLRALVLMNRDNFNAVSFAETLLDQYAFMDAAYNGGISGVLQERVLCQQIPGCNPNIWFNHVENTSNKAKTALSGYGQGFFQINRKHVKDVIHTKRQKYLDAGME